MKARALAGGSLRRRAMAAENTDVNVTRLTKRITRNILGILFLCWLVWIGSLWLVALRGLCQ